MNPLFLREWNTKLTVAIGAFCLSIAGCDHGSHEPHLTAMTTGGDSKTEDATEQFEVPPPPFTEGIYPCTDCHEGMDVNPTRRKLEDEHTNIVLQHDQEHRWCLDCHDADNRDRLRLASGVLVDFSESYRLCGQCHGDKFRDWRAGIHGKRSGEWNGKKRYLLCAHCHNPHSPKFKKIEPLPAPERPSP